MFLTYYQLNFFSRYVGNKNRIWIIQMFKDAYTPSTNNFQSGHLYPNQ